MYRRRGRGRGRRRNRSDPNRNPSESGAAATATLPRSVELPAALTVQQLSDVSRLSPIELIKQLMRSGIMASVNDVIEYQVAERILEAFGVETQPTTEVPQDRVSQSTAEEEDPSLLQPRPPVVTILGHVDHGKTTLLDAIRKTNITAQEAGGITQHIGAYQVDYNGQTITFLDTPGHEAFTAMRARGAHVTDIAVLVVAADDGVMAQTVEAIDHARAATVPIIVAVNKIDLPAANLERVHRQLLEQSLLPEDLGGDVITVPLSAKSGDGLSDLMENILVVTEVAELKANPHRLSRGVVIEARMDKSRGPLATILVNSGTLQVGDELVVGTVRGRVKALTQSSGQRVQSAGPSSPVQVLGLSRVPQVGDVAEVVESERAARALVEKRERRPQAPGAGAAVEERFLARLRAGEASELPLVLKADVQGSVEALGSALEQLTTEQARLRLIHASSGNITEGDVLLAAASEALVLAFNVGLEPGAHRLAEAHGVDVRHYEVIYRLLEDMEGTLKGMRAPVIVDIVEGRGQVRAVFSVGRRSKAAGVYVTEGRFVRNASARVFRNGQVVHDGPIATLRHFQEDVREIATGLECGVVLEGFTNVQEGDVLEVHRPERTEG